MSNRLTFSLASLVLIMAFGLVFAPTSVMAHPVVDDPTPGSVTYITDHAADSPADAHPIVEKIELLGDAADQYVNTDSFNIRITFSSSGATPTNFAAANILPPTDWLVRDVLGTGLVYTARILPPSDAAADAPNEVIVLTGTVDVVDGTAAQDIYTAPNADGDDADTDPDITFEANNANPARAAVNLDVTPPVIGSDLDNADGVSGDSEVGVAQIRAIAPNREPLNDEWSKPFEVYFTVTDDMSNDLTTIAFKADPDEVTFGAPGGLGSSMYGATVTPKPNTGSANRPKTDVTITITLADKAGNMSMATVMVTLAARGGTGTGTTTPETPVTDPTDDLTGLTVPAQSYVILVHGTSTTEDAAGQPMSYPDNPADGATATDTMVWEGMPNLEDLLFRGGTITLTREKAADTALFDHDGDGADATTGKKADGTDGTKPRQYGARDVIITEVMAAVNTAKVGQAGHLSHQWIEIYNPLKVPVMGITVSSKYGRPPATAADSDVLLDRLSNVVGGGWKFEGLGQNGFDDDMAAVPVDGSTPGTPAVLGSANRDFISFYRKERGKDGHVKGHWATSTDVYYPGHLGTPGAGERGSAPTIGADTVSLKPAIINEVANYPDADQDYEWIEIMVTEGSQRFKNWEIEIITAAKTIKRVVTLPEIPDGQKISTGGILLITSTDPAGDPNHPLAAGYNVMKNDAQQANGVGSGHPVRYIVKKFDNNLPDGNFVLTLRTRNDRDNHEGIVDIAGYHNNLKIDESGFFTNLWPLRNYPAPVNKDGRNNDLMKGTVHYRQHTGIVGTGRSHGDTKVEHLAMRDIGWTGVGYKRNTDVSVQNGGTPGYPNGAIKSEGIAQGSQVIISEIMYDTSRNLPQWIELQNLSTAEGVNIDNWSIFVVNHNLKGDGEDYTEGELSERINLDGRIPPGQTFLIASTGSRSDTRLPSERIHNLRRGRGEKLLNPNGFRIELKAKTNEGDANKHQLVDDVGNLPDKPATSRRADAQSFMDPVWELPSGTTEDGDRVSISRKTTKKTDDQGRRTELLDLKEAGVSKWGWIRSDMDPRLSKMRETLYYGHSDDIGSPGATVGSVLPVRLSKFRPERLKDTGAVVIRWVTESETNNAGFNILRSDARDGEFTKLNTKLIAGKGTTSERTVYEFTDTSAKPNVVYYYQIQDVSFDGDVTTLITTHLRGNVTAAGKLTTTWGELKALQ